MTRQIFLLWFALNVSQVLLQVPFLTKIIKSKLTKSGPTDPDRTLDVGSKLSGLVAGGFDKLGYIPIATAVGQCEGQARYQVEMVLNRLRRDAEQQFNSVSADIEARCRSYVEYAARDCEARVNSLAEELEVLGRNMLTAVQEECQKEVTELAEQTTEQEEKRYRQLGEEEEARLRGVYEEQGKLIEKEVLKEFEE